MRTITGLARGLAVCLVAMIGRGCPRRRCRVSRKPRPPFGCRQLTRVEHRRARCATPIWRLGRSLFFEPSLSASGHIACASCHAIDHAWSDGRAHSVGAAPGVTSPAGRPRCSGTAKLNRLRLDRQVPRAWRRSRPSRSPRRPTWRNRSPRPPLGSATSPVTPRPSTRPSDPAIRTAARSCAHSPSS